MRTWFLGMALALLTAPGVAQDTLSVGVFKGWDGGVVPLFQYREGTWTQLQPERPWADTVGLARSWAPPSHWFFYRNSEFHRFTVGSPEQLESGVWIQRVPKQAVPTQRWFLVVSDTITQAYPFTDRRVNPNAQTALARPLRHLLDQAETEWMEQNGPIGPRMDGADSLEVGAGSPVFFTQFEQAPRGEWWYLRMSRAYGEMSGSDRPNCWKETHLVGWVRLAWPDRSVVATDLEFQKVDCGGMGASRLELLGEVKLDGRRFVLALQVGWESYGPVVIELTEDRPVVVARASFALDAS